MFVCMCVCTQFMSVNVDILNIVHFVPNTLLCTLCILCTFVYIFLHTYILTYINLDDDDFVHTEDVFIPSIALYLSVNIYFMFYLYYVVPFFWHFPLLLPSLSPSPLPPPLPLLLLLPLYSFQRSFVHQFDFTKRK